MSKFVCNEKRKVDFIYDDTGGIGQNFDLLVGYRQYPL